MPEERERRNVRQSIAAGAQRLLEARGLEREELACEMRRSGFKTVTSGWIQAFESGNRIPTWEQFFAFLRICGTSLSGFQAIVEGRADDLPAPLAEDPSEEQIGPALSRLRKRELIPEKVLVKRLGTDIPMTLEKLRRWEKGTLIPTLPRALAALWALDLDLADLEKVLIGPSKNEVGEKSLLQKLLEKNR